MVLPLLVFGPILMSSCGMVNDAHGESAHAADMPVSDSRPRAETVSGPVEEPERSTAPASSPGETNASPTATTQPLSERSDLSSESLAAIDRCERVVAFQSAGYALYLTALGKNAVPVETFRAVLDSLNALAPAVSASGNEALQSVLGVLEPAARQMMREPEVPVTDVQALIDRVVPRLTNLLADLMHGCPPAIAPNTIDQVERLQLGTASL